MYHFKGRIRLIDSITVPWLGGIPPDALQHGLLRRAPGRDVRQAGGGDPEMYGPNTDIGAYLKYNIGTLLPKRPRASRWTNLVDDLETVLRRVEPALIVAPHPQLDSHVDHQFTTVAPPRRSRGRQRVTLLLHQSRRSDRYPYGPAGTLMSLPPPVAQGVMFDRVYSHPVRRIAAPEVVRPRVDARPAFSPSRLYQVEIGQDRASELEKQVRSSRGR